MLTSIRAVRDTVSHNILLSKPEKYGFRETAYNWVLSYLSERRHFDRHKINSSPETVTRSLPKGSIFVPLLFLFYVYDISKVSSVFLPILLADDTNMLVHGNNVS